MKSVIVVGAGFAGLSAAIELANRGARVQVFEAYESPGGRARAFTQGGFSFDGGPTLLVMVDVLRRTMGDAAFERLEMLRLEPGYRVLWGSGEHFDMHSNVALFLEELARYEPPGRRHRAIKYLADVHEQYVESRAKILDVDHTAATFLRAMLSPGAIRPQILGNLRRFVERSFVHPRLVQALTFQPLYLGMSPLRAPALYSLLAVAEITGGVWAMRGGTAAVVGALARRAEQLGVEFHYGCTVHSVRTERGHARLVESDRGATRADGVVITADREPALQTLLHIKPPAVNYGHSAMVWYLAVDREVNLPHHSVMLPDDPWSAYAQLDAGRLPDAPMAYVCNSAASDPGVAPAGKSALMVLAPVPNCRALPEFDENAFFFRVLSTVERHAGPLRSHVIFRHSRGPREFAQHLHLAHGAAFGPDHNLRQMGPFRPSIRDSRLRNVVFAGSGTHPGSGVPMVLISGRLAAQRLTEALA